MADKTHQETSPLEDLTEFVRAMMSQYGRLPALKRLARLISKWFFGGAVVVAVCILGEVLAVGFRKAAGMYWPWWLWPPFFVAATPIAFTIVFAALEVACYAVLFPFVLIGMLLGYDRSASSKRVGNGLVYLEFALLVAWAAPDSARTDAMPKPATHAVAATSATPAAHEPDATAAPISAAERVNWWTIGVALASFFGGLAQTTFQ